VFYPLRSENNLKYNTTMKNALTKIFSNRTNQSIICIYILLELLMWNYNFSIVWLVVLTLILALGIILEGIYEFPLKKSVLIQFVIIISFVIFSIIYGVVTHLT